MVFVGIEFLEADGGGLALIHEKWLTPRKKEVWWPPVKQRDHFSKALKKGESPAENWKIYSIARTFFEEDDFTKASKKLKLAENFSDIQSENEELPSKRPVKKRALFTETSSDEDDTASKSKVRKVLGLSQILEKKNKQSCAVALNNSQESQEASSDEDDTPSQIKVRKVLELSQILEKKNKQSCAVALNNSQESQETSIDEERSCQAPSQNIVQDRHGGQQNNEITDTSINDFYKKIISYLVTIKNQNNEIIARLKERENIATAVNNSHDLPIQLPAKTSRDIHLLEEYLNDDEKLAALSSHCASFGGRDLTNRINIVLKNLITNKLATEFNFCGSRGDKEAFAKLKLRTVVVNAILQKCPSISIQEIEDKIKIWLKHAPKRVSLERRRTMQ